MTDTTRFPTEAEVDAFNARLNDSIRAIDRLRAAGVDVPTEITAEENRRVLRLDAALTFFTTDRAGRYAYEVTFEDGTIVTRTDVGLEA